MRSPALDFALTYATSARVTLGHLRYGGEVAVGVPPPEQFYHVVLPLAGTCRVAQRHGVAELRPGERGAVLSPDEPLTVCWEPDSVGYVLKVPRASLEAHLGRLTGAPVDRPVEFALDFDLATGGGQALAASVPFLWHELTRPGGIAGMPLAREHLEYVVLTQLLSVVPHNYSAELAAERPAPSRRSNRLQQVVDIIEAHPEEPLSSAHLAAAAGVTERTLQLAFRKEFGTSPSEYVRGSVSSGRTPTSPKARATRRSPRSPRAGDSCTPVASLRTTTVGTDGCRPRPSPGPARRVREKAPRSSASG